MLFLKQWYTKVSVDVVHISIHIAYNVKCKEWEQDRYDHCGGLVTFLISHKQCSGMTHDNVERKKRISVLLVKS